MNLYTILISFEDKTTGIEQYFCKTPEEALFTFIKESESLCKYDTEKLLKVVKSIPKLTIHLADMKGFWIIDFGLYLYDIHEFSSIYGGYIIQSDTNGAIRIN